jgi:hypothetical protein
VVLSEAPIPVVVPTMPWPRLKCPVPRVRSAMMSGTITPNTEAVKPSRSCTATSRFGSLTVANRMLGLAAVWFLLPETRPPRE